VATYVSDRFRLDALLGAYRADLEFHGVDQAVPSYEGRVFLDNPDATADTAKDETSGYLGSFFVFGKVECWGEEGHCDDPVARRKFDRRRNPTRFAKVRLTVPEGRLERVLGQGGDEHTISVVAVLPNRPDYADFDPAQVLTFQRLSIVAYA
jgi:hypothetical protein